ncbi:uncharacterized protein PHALS_01506 [Plasmopara halstedii]|uniref:Uncharacterized protein n=1 Tax=Plasmopara halstedii TaxID=4781 RepID=A0A0P1ATH5_PLAHL|nr:uncharacterized protein PHALS_01506 [Plasmopara halstedii]CEG45191.1 hypothetical protein PHALS_01506 [Plasmopara halstedii]|eukprot:XP_024581560.1 hypothetical protein PHALS_01506 [Plasmopara halstedii]
MDIYPNASNVNPFTDRFVELVRWRRDVNLAQDAHLPCDSGSKLYAEYASNLFSITTSGLYRLTSDKEIQFRSTINGVFSQDLIIAKPSVLELQGSGSGIMVVVVSPTEASQGSTSASIDVAASDLEPKAISKESLISPVIESSDAISKEATARTFSSDIDITSFSRESSQSWESLSTNLYYDLLRRIHRAFYIWKQISNNNSKLASTHLQQMSISRSLIQVYNGNPSKRVMDREYQSTISESGSISRRR